jgi:hypothetical protein
MQIGQVDVPHETVAAYVAEGATRFGYHPLENLTIDRIRERYAIPSNPVVTFFDASGNEVGTWTVISPLGVADTSTRNRKCSKDFLDKLIVHNIPRSFFQKSS